MSLSIAQAFENAKTKGKAAFIPYISGGHPDLRTCSQILKTVSQNGADIIEVGIPFSDPVADGPVIQAAGVEALENGATPQKVFDMIAQTKDEVSCPIVVMTYFNIILHMGLEAFAENAVKAGVNGVIIPDLTADEAEDWIKAAEKFNLDTIFLTAPTTPDSRLRMIVKACKGFVYYVSTTGVTGSKIEISEAIKQGVQKVHQATDMPVAVGFGVATPDQAKELGKVADGVIVGSALVKTIQDQNLPEEKIKKAGEFCNAIAQALNN